MGFRKNTTDWQFSPPTPTLKEKWDIQKAKIKIRYPSLSDNDLHYALGKKGIMWDKIEKKLGLSKEELRKLIVLT